MDSDAKSRSKHTIESLRLDLEAAEAGKTWLLLPQGFRHRDAGQTYPLPVDRSELQRLISIPVPGSKQDSGCVYIRRAMDVYRNRQKRRQSAVLDISMRQQKVVEATSNLQDRIKQVRREISESLEGVRQESQRAIASLNDLFALGREGLEGQMRAHLLGKLWKNEEINSKAFRDCFRMVAQAVKGLGLPSEQREKAAEAIMEEAAASMRATQEAISMADDGEIEGITSH